MRVLLVNSLYAPDEVGGAERSVRSLAEELTQAGVDVHVAALTRQGLSTEKLSGVTVHRIGLANLYWPFGDVRRRALSRAVWHWNDRANAAMARQFSSLLEDVRPDLVHTNNLAGFSVSLWRAAKRNGLPLVHTLRDYYLVCPRSTMYRTAREGHGANCDAPCRSCGLFSAGKREASEDVDWVVGISRHILERHGELGFFAGITGRSVVHNGPLVQPAVSTVAPQGSPDKLLRVGYLGRLSPEKGIETLIDACLHESLRDRLTLQVAGLGDEEYGASLMSRASSPTIRFVGQQDPSSFLEQLDLLVVPSLWREAFGRVVVEAFAHRVPVIATRTGGLPEIVDDGVTGYLFPPGDVSELVRIMDSVLADRSLLPALAQAAVERVATLVPARVAGRYLEVYSAVASGR